MEDEYVLGTHDAEIERLELQHQVWPAAAIEAWRRAGISAGQTLVDLGCGPGFAAADSRGRSRADRTRDRARQVQPVSRAGRPRRSAADRSSLV